MGAAGIHPPCWVLIRRWLLPAGLVVCQAAPAEAQLEPVLTNPVLTNPGLQQQQELQQQQQRQAPSVQSSEPAPLIQQPGQPGQAPAGDATLLIRQVRVSGARAIPASAIEAVFAPLLSTAAQPRPVRFAQLQDALNAASNLYRSRGYLISRVGGAPIALSSGGQSWLGNLALRYPLLLSRTGSLGLALAGELQDASSNTYLDGQLAIANPSRLRVLRLGVDGNLSTPFYASSANLQISQGLPIADAYDGATWAQSGGALPSGSVSYTSARLTLRHQQRLGRGNSFATATASGQLTGSVLPAPEDFSYGGPFLGRAFRGSYLVGDQGAGAGLELSHSFYSTNWTLTPFVFGDLGVASNNGRLSAPANYQAASYGLGLRGSWGSSGSMELGWGIPTGAYPQSTGQVGVSSSIVYFRATVTF